MRKRITEIADVVIGYQHRGKLSTKSKGSHQIVQVKDIDKESEVGKHCDLQAPFRIWLGNLFKVTPKNDANYYAIREHDVLFLSRGRNNFAIPIVKSYVEPFSMLQGNIIAAYYFYILRIRTDQVLPTYLAWFLNQKEMQARMESISQGSHMTMISKRDFSYLEVEIPSLTTQQRIVKLYHLGLREKSLLEELKNKRTELIDTLCSRAAASDN